MKSGAYDLAVCASVRNWCTKRSHSALAVMPTCTRLLAFCSATIDSTISPQGNGEDGEHGQLVRPV